MYYLTVLKLYLKIHCIHIFVLEIVENRLASLISTIGCLRVVEIRHIPR